MTDIQEEEGFLEEMNYTDDIPGSIFTPTFITVQSGWYSFIFTLGVIGNLYIIVTVFTARATRRSATNLFIVNLAISDLLILLICLPQIYIHDYFSWPLGKTGCRLLIPLNEVFFAVSILTLTVITIDRHRAIVHPFKTKLGRKSAKVIIVFVWVLSYFVVGFPLTFVIEMRQLLDDEYKCEMKWSSPGHRQLHTCFIVFLVVVPLLIIAFGYVRIITTMRKQSERIKKRTSTTNSIGSSSSYVQDMHTLDENKKLMKMLAVLVVVFWICIFPLVLLALVLEFIPDDSFSAKTIEGLYTFTMALFFTNSAFNPVAIYIMSSEIRQGFYRVPFSLKSCRR